MRKVRKQRETDTGFLKMPPAHHSQFNAITVEATKITIKK